MIGWQWHQLDHMQIICTSFQTDNHASTLLLNFFTDWMLFLTPNQQRQSTRGNSQHCCWPHAIFIHHSSPEQTEAACTPAPVPHLCSKPSLAYHLQHKHVPE